MTFIFTGFTSETGMRVFAFQGVRSDRSSTEFRVKADLSLVRRYGISVQELPLLCREVLERGGEESARTLTFGEEDMSTLANRREAVRLAAARKRPARRPRPAQNPQVGSAWRTTQL